MRMFLILLAGCSSLAVTAQDHQFIDPAKTIEEGIKLFDSAKYALAANEFQKIDYRDTAYLLAQTELVKTYLVDKKYNEAIAICTSALQLPGAHKATLMRVLGKAYSGLGDVAKATAMFNAGLAEFPFDFTFTYSIAAMHYDRKEYDLAAEYFFKTLDINPFHPASHFYLGRLSILRGEKVHAMMSAGMYLGINNKVNSELVMLENFMNNEVTDEGTVQGDARNAFEKLDQIIRAKIVFDKKFKWEMPTKVTVVRQFELLFDQLPPVDPSSEDPWVRFYLPVFNKIKASHMQYAFLYHILELTEIEVVHQWSKKNEKTLKIFYTTVNESLMGPRSLKEAAMFGFTGKVSCRYDDNQRISNIGNLNAKGEREGRWIYFEDNGAIIAEGLYSSGKKTGIWKYSSKDGVLLSVENNTTGEIRRNYTDQAGLHFKYFVKNEIVEGTAETYYPCGIIKEKIPYLAGKKEGTAIAYFPDGTILSNHHYKADKREGLETYNFENGAKKYDQLFKDNLQQGAYTSYRIDGKIHVTGSYDKDLAEGPWKYFHPNGKPHETGQYKGGNASGEWKYYDIRGRLTEIRNYNDKGELHGENILYENTVMMCKAVYKENKLSSIVYYNNEGKAMAPAENVNGNIHVKMYWPNGKLRKEGFYKDGEPDSTWTYYYLWGAPKGIYTYAGGKLNGACKTYHESGKLNISVNYTAGEYDGYYKEHFSNGILKAQGWFVNGEREQLWLFYYADGTLESDSYYIGGSAQGPTISYSVDGNKAILIEKKDNRVEKLQYFDATGRDVAITTKKDAVQKVEQRYKNGKPFLQLELLCNVYHNDIIRYLPDGTVYSRNPYRNGKHSGKYTLSYISGVHEGGGNYANDQATGTWTWYHENGKKYSVGNYADGERDSVWSYYFYNGNMSSQSSFIDGTKDGLSKIYSPEGTLIAEKKFVEDDVEYYRATGKDGKMGDWKLFDNNSVITAYFADGKIAMNELYKNGTHDGVRELFYATGKPYMSYKYLDGMSEGESILYYPNGAIREKFMYKNDERDGLAEINNEDGTPLRTETYKLGVLHGETKIFKGGKVVQVIKYWSGDAIGSE